MTSIVTSDEPYSWKMTLDEFLQEGNIPIDWIEFFKANTELLTKISDLLNAEYKEKATIYPEIYRVFRTFSISPNDISVVILGQDPYHNGNAVGLCFSAPPGSEINPSLRNIYTELKNEGFSPETTGSLVHWLNQGCFMLNTALTVRKGEPESHVHIWYEFTERLIQYIVNKNSTAIWVLMGSKAFAFKPLIKGHVLVTSHPSPYSAHKGFQNHPAFIKSNLFRDVNDLLEIQGKKRIQW